MNDHMSKEDGDKNTSEEQGKEVSNKKEGEKANMKIISQYLSLNRKRLPAWLKK